MKSKTVAMRFLASMIAFGLTISLGTVNGKDLELRLRLKKGDSYSLKMTVDQKTFQTVMGQKHDMAQTIGFGYVFDVNDVAKDGTAMIKFTFKSSYFKQQGPTGTIEYDSSNPTDTDHPMAKTFASIMGQSLTMQVTPKWHVKEIKGCDEMINHILEQLDLPEGPTTDQIVKSIKDQFGDKAFKEIWQQMMNIYPEKPIAIGDFWSRRFAYSMGVPMIIENAWILKERKNGIAFIDVNSKIKSDPDAGPVKMGNMTLTYDVTGDQNGTLELLEATGWIIRAKLIQKLSGMVEYSGVPALEGRNVPISIESVINIETLDQLKKEVFSVEIFQDGKKVNISDRQVYLKKKPFTIYLTLDNIHGVSLNPSFIPEYYNLEKDQPVKDLKYLHLKSFAEKKFNVGNDLIIAYDGFHYLGYNEKMDWHKFNSIKKKENKVIGERIVKNFFIYDKKQTIKVEDIDKDIYLFLVAVTDYKENPEVKEIQREAIKIVWK